MSAGHSLRRQNYSFVSFAPPVEHASPSEVHRGRIVLAIFSAIVVTFSTFATLAMLMTGR